MKDEPIITLAIAALFFLGLLYAGWLNGIRTWIGQKVNEK